MEALQCGRCGHTAHDDEYLQKIETGSLLSRYFPSCDVCMIPSNLLSVVTNQSLLFA